MRRFTGQYADNGKEVRLATRAAAGHRCVRCGHPFESGKHGKGEWSPCDEQCAHLGSIRIGTFNGKMEFQWAEIPIPDRAAGMIVSKACSVEAQWRILTVHHLDGNKANDVWWNTLALCQRCHLQIQTRVDPEVPYFLEHSDWFKPYAAGFYAHKYEGRNITREEATARMEELLRYELLTKS